MIIKTIFVTIFQGVEFRNLVRSDVCKLLAASPNIRLIFFTNSEVKKKYYASEFNGPNIVYEVIENYRPTSPLNGIFWFLKFNLIKTKTIDIKREQQLRREKKYFKHFLKLVFNRLFARKFFRRIARFADWRLVRDDFFAPYFKKYQPRLVLAAHLFSDMEGALVRQAKKMGVPTVGVINSWDKLTARCMIRILPDKLMVHNRLVKEDAAKYADMASADILVTGLPHFDFYINEGRTPKEDFFGKNGLKPEEKIILFCPAGTVKDLEAHAKSEKFYSQYSDPDTETIALLDGLIASGELGDNLRLVVRFPPNDNVNISGGYKTKVVFQTPGRRFTLDRGQDWDMNRDDFKELADTLYYSSVVLTYPSTMVIDAAAFKKPVINLDIDFPNTPRNFLTWFYEVDHYQPVLKTKAAPVVKTKAEMAEWIKKFLKDPEINKKEREELVKLECEPFDGRAGQRVADFVLAQINHV